VPRFAQHSRLRARPRKRADLIAKFLEIPVMQADNPACELTIVSSSPEEEDTVFLTEVWSSAEDYERARQSPEVQDWAAEMPSLVAGPPQITPLVIEGGKGLRSSEPSNGGTR
jgi:quinol monooxygenase YgiN